MARTKDFCEVDVLEKAINIFWHKGYSGTSMQDLVEGLGISRSSLYDTFTDKHTLFLRALESYQVSAKKKISTITDSPGAAKEHIKRLLELITDGLINDQHHKGCFMVNAEVEVAPHDEEVNKIICLNDRQLESAFYEIIKKGQECSELKNDTDARALARFTFNTVKGLRVSAKSITDKAYFDDVIELALKVLE